MRRKDPLLGVTLVYSYSCKPADEESKALADKQIDLGCEYRNRLIKNAMICKNENVFVAGKDATPEEKEVAKQAKNLCVRKDREAYVARGLWYGTYWLAEEAAQQAVKMRWKSRSCSERGLDFDRGRLGAGIQSTEIATCGGARINSTKVVLLEDGKRLRMSCGAGRQTSWNVKLHRPLPTGRVLRAVIVRERTSSLARFGPRKYDYFLQFTIQTEEVAIPQPLAGLRVGLDLGWWSEEDTIRVFDLVDENGYHERMLLPDHLTSKHFHTHSIESIRDKGRGGLKLRTIVERSQESAEAEERRKQIAHLDSWAIAQERKTVRQRNEFYMQIARELCKRYAEIFVEDMKISTIALDKSRRFKPQNRVLGAPGKFRAILKQAARKLGTTVTEVTTEWTTQTCSVCGDTSMWEHPGEREHRCAACGSTYERPWNSARNILQKGASRKPDAAAAE